MSSALTPHSDGEEGMPAMPSIFSSRSARAADASAGPQGQAVGQALTALGFAGVADVRVGKAVTFQLDRPDEVAAERDAKAMCERFLANPVTEAFTVLVEGTS